MDLGSVKSCLVKRCSWSPERAERVAKEYRLFLDAAAEMPGSVLAPSEDIDEFWHWHVLDTRKYYQDCMSYLGIFIDHNPTPARACEIKQAELEAFCQIRGLAREVVEGLFFQGRASDQKHRINEGLMCTDEVDGQGPANEASRSSLT